MVFGYCKYYWLWNQCNVLLPPATAVLVLPVAVPCYHSTWCYVLLYPATAVAMNIDQR